jgi:hypothetical protein
MAKDSGEYDAGVVDVVGESIDVAPGFPREMVRDKLSGVPQLHFKLFIDRGLSFDSAKKKFDEKAKNDGGPLPNDGFYIGRKCMHGRTQDNMKKVALILQKPISAFLINPIPVYRVFYPNTGLSKTESFREFVGCGELPSFTRVTPEEAEVHWTRHYNESKSHCAHGPSCKRGKPGIICTDG